MIKEASVPEDRLQKVIDLELHRFLGSTGLVSNNGRGGLSFVVGNHTANPAGVLHGGVVYLLCDVCAYAGLLSILPDDREAVTHDIHVSVLRAVNLGDTVQMTSRILKQGRILCFFDVQAVVADELIATARVTKSLIPRAKPSC